MGIPRQHTQFIIGFVHQNVVVVRHADIAIDINKDRSRDQIGSELLQIPIFG